MATILPRAEHWTKVQHPLPSTGPSLGLPRGSEKVFPRVRCGIMGPSGNLESQEKYGRVNHATV